MTCRKLDPDESMNKSSVPNYLIVGTQRGATTWLHNAVTEHPQVSRSHHKELRFFNKDENWNRGVDWYKSFFVDRNLLIGDATPEYMCSQLAIERIHLCNPETKIVISLREPVSRAYSAFKLFKNTIYGGYDFEEAINEDIDGLFSRGLYADQVNQILAKFGSENVNIILFEDIRRNNEKIITEMFKFLQIDSEFEPSIVGQRYNSGILPNIQAELKRNGLGTVVSLFKKTRAGEWIRRRAHRSSPKCPPLGEEIASRLRAKYEPHNLRLEQTLGRQIGW